ncbi:MAG: DUF4878 domain-containing protein [Chloroflexia bacterium]|nr:DUF4878 domain-containing protein [Chloroflexia bacterium]
MKGTDRFLIGIVVGILLLVAVALAVALLRPEPSYQAEDTPEGVAHNYLFALTQGDYERAYGYLSPALAGYPPSAAAFIQDVNSQRWPFRELEAGSTSLAVESSRVQGDRATVTVRVTYFEEGDLLRSSQRTDYPALELRREEGGWKIYDADRFFLFCWKSPQGCP